MSERLIDTMQKSRIVFLQGVIDESNANNIVMNLLNLDGENNEDIYLYINSPGGSVDDGLAIIDTMNYIKSDVVTIGIGKCASMAAIILACGAKGKRYALKNTSIMLHQIMGGVQGQASDIEIVYHRTKTIKENINELLSDVTGKSKNKVETDLDRDYWLSSAEAKEYGLIDEVVLKKE